MEAKVACFITTATTTIGATAEFAIIAQCPLSFGLPPDIETKFAFQSGAVQLSMQFGVAVTTTRFRRVATITVASWKNGATSTTVVNTSAGIGLGEPSQAASDEVEATRRLVFARSDRNAETIAMGLVSFTR